MKKVQLILHIIIWCCMVKNGYSQNRVGIQMGYGYFYCPGWDKIVATYNFSRPFLNEPQPFLTHGFMTGAHYTLKLGKYLRGGIEVNYAMVRSAADNFSTTNYITIHQIAFQPMVTFYPLKISDKYNGKKISNMWIEVSPSVFLYRPKLKTNESVLALDEDEEEKYGGTTTFIQPMLGVGMDLMLRENMCISPFLRYNYSPRVIIEGFAPAIHGSYNTGLTDETILHNWILGVKLSYIWKEKEKVEETKKENTVIKQ